MLKWLFDTHVCAVSRGCWFMFFGHRLNFRLGPKFKVERVFVGSVLWVRIT